MKAKSVSVIFDTNVWISFLIGKRLSSLHEILASRKINIIYCNQLILEMRLVTSKPKLKKYFQEAAVEEMIDLIKTIGFHYSVKPQHHISRDAKDDFLLDLAAISNADFLVTGDKDLLILHPFLNTSIVSPSVFEKRLKG